ncbi:MAG: homocysteine S-methyltransferase family protein [Nocardioides sp.]
MSARLTALLDGRRFFDGGYGWLLAERGLEPGTVAESWNLDNPEAIGQLHEEYAAAGAQLLTTNTFGGTRYRLEGYGLGDRVREVNVAAARIARDVAARHDALVAGCVGPTGELLEPLGIMTQADARDAFAEQIGGLVEGGADLILIETMSDLGEAKAAISAATETDLPIIATMSFDTNLHTMMGVSPSLAVGALAEAGADAVGANCGRGPGEMEQIAQAMVAARGDLDVLLIAQSNAGLPQVDGGGFAYDVDPTGMAEHVARLRDIGIDITGACCGSAPAHVHAIGDRLSKSS